MKWIKLFEEYSDFTKIEKGNIIFLTYQIMKELNAMKLKEVENNDYIYFYTGAKGEEKVKFILNKIARAVGYKDKLLVPRITAEQISAKFYSNYSQSINYTLITPANIWGKWTPPGAPGGWGDGREAVIFENCFLVCVRDFFANKYITRNFTIEYHKSNMGGHQTNLKKVLKEQS